MRKPVIATVRTLLAAAALLAAAGPGAAMDFRRAGQTVVGQGEIVAGDADRFTRFLADNRLETGPDKDDVTLLLSGPGGDPDEGMRLGHALRDQTVLARVARGETCAAACALAFLGGTRVYATGIGPGRLLEWGGRLTFRGLLDAPGAHLPVARLLGYADDIGATDRGALVAAAIPAGADAPPVVSTPRELEALHIEPVDAPAAAPKDWFIHACERVQRSELPPLDDRGLSTDSIKPIPTLKALRGLVLPEWTANPVLARAAAQLDDRNALDAAMATSLFSDGGTILDARLVPLERGAGFYYDECAVFRTKDTVGIAMLDQVSHRLVARIFYATDATLAMYGEASPLW